MGLTLLAYALMPITYWDHSFTTTVQLINHLPTPKLPNTISPYQALTNKTPTYSNFKAFGCLYFPLLTPYNKHKLEFKSTPCVYLGSSPQHKGSKCLSATGRIYISKDVKFHETSFPYQTLFSKPSKQLPSPTSTTPALPLPTTIPTSLTSPTINPTIITSPTTKPTIITSPIISNTSPPPINDPTPTPSSPIEEPSPSPSPSLPEPSPPPPTISSSS